MEARPRRFHGLRLTHGKLRPLLNGNCLQAGHSRLELLIEGFIINMCIALGHVQVLVAEQFAEGSNRHATIDEARSERVPKLMG